MEPSMDTAVSYVRCAVRILRGLALSQIPDLDAVAPPRRRKWSKQQYAEWVAPALKRSLEAIAWRDAVLAKIGSVEIRNTHKPDSAWDHTRLSEELGFHLVRRVKDSEGNDAKDEQGRYQSEPNPNWGPPETLLGEFYRDEELEERRKIRGDDKQTSDYLPGAHPVLYLGTARTYLGDVPKHLTGPMPFALLTGRIGFCGEEYDLQPYHWWEYADILLKQCLLVRARALELCGWCDQRMNVLRTALHPIVRIGPVLKGKRNRRSLRVEVAGQPLRLETDTISFVLAECLLKVRGGKSALFNRAYVARLIALIPPLSGLLRPVERHQTGQKLGRNDATYTLDAGVVVEESDHADTM